MWSQERGIVPAKSSRPPRRDDREAGDEVEVFLERLEDANGYVVLSKTKAQKMKAWEEVENAFRKTAPSAASSSIA